MNRVVVSNLCLLVSATFLGCTSQTPAEYAADHGCADAWVDLCNELSCNPESAEWANCKLNGWRDKKSVESCIPETGWPGDEYALCPPKEGEGLQLHYGPASYDDADEIARYMLDSHAELNDCFLLNSPNQEKHYLNQYAGRMRPQSHHMILWGVGEDPTMPLPRGLGTCSGSATLGSSFYLGAQNLKIDIPNLRNHPDADEEISARPLPADQLFSINMHYLNRSPDPILRESWINMYYADPSLITKEAKAIFLIQPVINLPPHSTGTIVSGGCPAPKARTVRLLNGHFHQGGQSFTVYRKRVGGERELVYASYNWADPYIGYFTGGATNPAPDRTLGISGGTSGPIQLNAGDSLEWECDMDNPKDTTVKFGETGGDQMCILFGMYIDDEPDTAFNWNMASIRPGVCIDSGRAGGISVN